VFLTSRAVKDLRLARAVDLPRLREKEIQDRKGALYQRPPGGRGKLTLHHGCFNGHVLHVPLVTTPGTRPMPCDCEATA